ncbi:MAG: methyltransferase regulatory domain-containing protein [Candidatus Berkiella sp.]
MSESIAFSYDITEYESRSYAQTHPDHLYTLAKLFGLQPTEFAHARILELGCASGGNIIPLACQAPSAYIVGVDLSAVQIQRAARTIKELKLTNIEVFHLSIEDISEAFGQFDYIICHGIYSWVPESVREKILVICQRHLAPHGVAYISYNTLPGWNVVKSIREMMLYHTNAIHDPMAKAKEARNVLNFIVKGLANDTSPYANFLRNEIEILANQPDSYLIHDHLGEVNQPFYFYQFIESAQKHQLAYLSDTDLALMYPSNLPPKLADEISKINDVVACGQYLDFILNQRFRCTLLCHEKVKVNRHLLTQQIKSFYISFKGQVQPKGQDPHNNEPMKFIGQHITLTLTDPLAKVAMLKLAEHKGKPIAFDALCDSVVKEIPSNDRTYVEWFLIEELNLMRLVLGGLINIHSNGGRYADSPGETPLVAGWIQYQLKHQTWVTNHRHENISLNDVERFILQHCDGQISVKELSQKLTEFLALQKVGLLGEDGRQIDNAVEIEQRSYSLCQSLLNEFSQLALIVNK